MTPPPRHTIHQTGVMAALVDGVFDGDTTVATLLTRGDTGLGTFDGLDGEMVILDGVCHRLTDDGSARPADAAARTPFAVVTRFTTHLHTHLSGPLSRAAVREAIDALLPSSNYLYAVRIDGRFTRMRVRAVHAQQPPYPPLVAATADQTTLAWDDVAGTVVAFRSPAFEHGVAVPGYHAHFLRGDHAAGGHILDYELRHADVRVCIGTDLHLELPRTAPFATAHLDTADLDAQVERAEG